MISTEVRINNLVEYDGRVFKIHTIADQFPTLDTIEFGVGVVGWRDIKPIKLTKERLIEFGFERKTRITNLDQKIPVWALFSFSLTIWDDGRLFYDWIGGNIEVNHVHHIQNIYSDLLREELPIK